MNEIQSILDAWHSADLNQSPGVIATIVHVEGSAYRRPGARMFMLPNGERTGTISGGCLEGDVSKKAWWLTDSGKPVVRIYDTTSEDEAIWEFGLGCNGVVKVLLERTDMESADEAMRFLDHCTKKREAGVIAVVIRASHASGFAVGDRLMLDANGVWGGSLRDRELVSQAEDVLLKGKNRLVESEDCDAFVEHIAPPVELTIFGAGHDAIPLVAIAKEVGWHVTVADGRPAYAKTDRFPGVDRIVLLSRDSFFEIGTESVVVLMTHNYPQDRDLLRQMFALRPAYLGVLGPKKRTERLLEEIGVEVSVDGLHAPAGLDIGADTPQAIALSIVAEIQAVLAGRGGGMLRLRDAPIYVAEDVRRLVA